MRYFIALDLPNNIKDSLHELQKKIGSQHARVNWVSKKNLHITLHFLGDVDSQTIFRIRDFLTKVLEKSFSLRLGSLFWYPHEQDVHVIWVNVEPEKDIFNLYGAIELTLGSLLETNRSFSVHLTLGRVKLIKDRKKFLMSLSHLEVPPSSFLIDHFTLIKSDLSKDGPRYTSLQRYPLL